MLSIDTVHPNLKQLSHSSDANLCKCPRYYELMKLGDQDNEENEDTRFGHAVGTGVQRLFMPDASLNRVYLQTLSDWGYDLDGDDGRDKKKTFWHVLLALDKFSYLRSTEFANYELVFFDGKPAVELGFSISLGDGFHYRGFLDALLINRSSRELIVYEGKTTKYKQIHEAQYKNSGQSIGYSVVIDALVSHQLDFKISNSFTVKYNVWKCGAAEWEILEFRKSHTDRALWLKNIFMQKERVLTYATEEFFPMHGNSCYDFFRPCEFFDECHMSNKVLVPNPIVRVDDPAKYTFKFSWEEIIEAQLLKQRS